MKRYRSLSCISFNVLIAGKRRHIDFDPVTMGGSTFMTGNVELQEALEHSPLFNREFWLESADQPTATHEPQDDLPPADLQPIEAITTAADGKAFLVERGALSSVLTSKAKINEAAAELGFSFPNLK